MRAIFPVRNASGGGHVLHNGALPATGPAWFEHCLDSQLPDGADGAMSGALRGRRCRRRPPFFAPSDACYPLPARPLCAHV